MVTVSSLIDELEDAHRESMGAAEKQAWVEVDRLTALVTKLEVERDAARAALENELANGPTAEEWRRAVQERDDARARVALLERELAHIRDQVAASMRAAGVTL